MHVYPEFDFVFSILRLEMCECSSTKWSIGLFLFRNCVKPRGSLNQFRFVAVVIENKNWNPNAHFKLNFAYSIFLFHFPVSIVTNSRAEPHQTPSVEKHAHPSRSVYGAINQTLTRFTKFRVSNLHISSTSEAANTLRQRIPPREAISSQDCQKCQLII